MSSVTDSGSILLYVFLPRSDVETLRSVQIYPLYPLCVCVSPLLISTSPNCMFLYSITLIPLDFR